MLTTLRVLMTCCFLLLSVFPAHAAKHALLIGIADYKNTGFSDLDGTINDLELVRGLLKEKFQFKDEEIRMLKDREASHTGIKKAFAELAQRVKKDDVVYIHYSGHGSLTRDLTGDKKPLYVGGPAFDSTWVPFGSRAKDAKAFGSLDLFDILDDEVGEWLGPIYAKTDNVILVSDSCHSGNMTRGANPPKVRAIEKDERIHPLAKQKFTPPKESGVVIGAARDDQQAGEFAAPDSKSYGLFTWNWVQALSQASPDESWDEAFKRTQALMGAMRESQQHPQIEGKVTRSVFGGDFPSPVASVAITETLGDNEVIIKAGSFAGVTVGSTYRKKGGEDRFVIVSAEAFQSRGEVKNGSFNRGDLAVEETHVYPYTPFKVYVTADLAADKGWADAIRNALPGIQGYQVVADQKEADLLLMVIRPKRNGESFVKARPEDTLPKADPAARPEIWVLTPGEQQIREKIEPMKPNSEQRAVELVKENLNKLSRIRELKRLGVADGGATPLVELFVSHYTPDSACMGAAPACLQVPGMGKFRLVRSVPSVELQGSTLAKGDVLTFRVKNNSSSDLYCYLIDISPSGTISVIFPMIEHSNSAVLVPAGKEKDFSDISGLRVDEPGEDTMKLIAAKMPLQAALFEQSGFVTRGETKGSENPLESFLSRSMGGATRSGFSMKKDQWGTVMFSFEGH